MKGGKAGRVRNGTGKPAAHPFRIRSFRSSLRVPLYSFAGSGLGSGGFIVKVDPHESAGSGLTSYWGCLRRRFRLVLDR
jgi:hypothetical protein